ncbi:LuxR family two component transcriptional regulator [Leucobacter komagatae]|uniref:LuxR family two component transcriptional regulator n=2 Tax=Leucobacter komagatae TaxID=55969 RepID=A0A542Y3R2_9MICO|nr:LuxR family two component transcriptional regulator [Leucobacter komagatae]
MVMSMNAGEPSRAAGAPVGSGDRIRLLLVDDQALVRGALGALLGLEPDLEVVGYAAGGAEAIALATELRPDVCLMDIQMAGMDGIAATRALLEVSPTSRVLIVTTFARPGYLRSALDAGASGFVVKDASPEQLAESIRQVHRGRRVVDPALAEASLFEGTNPLNERERQVLRRAAEGLTAPAIAAEIFLSAGTVRNLLSSAIGKVGAKNRAAAARIAVEKGWL